MPTVMSLVRAVLVTLALAPPVAAANDWLNLATISMTDPVTAKLANRYVCYTDGRDIRCDSPSLYVTSGGLVGINTSNPTTQLEVNGTVSATNFVGSGAGLTGVVASTGDRIVSGSTGGTRMVAISDTGYISVTQGGANTAWFDPTRGLVALGVSATGGISGTTGYFTSNVGIGTAAPTLVTAAATGLEIRGASGGIGSIRIGTPLNSWEFLSPGNAGNGNLGILDVGSGQYRIYVVSSSGNVGIGTTSPRLPLEVSGAILSSGGIWNNGFIASSTGVTGGWRFAACSAAGDSNCPASGAVIHQDYVNTRLAFTSSGSVGIGTVTPLAQLHVQATSNTDTTIGHFMLRSAASGAVNRPKGGVIFSVPDVANNETWQVGGIYGKFDSSNWADTRLTLQSADMNDALIDTMSLKNGRVGISTTNPVATLDVKGTISASNAIQVGQSALACGTGISGSIRYNTTSGTIQVCNGTGWISLLSGTAAGVTALANLTDVNITNIAGRDYLRYDSVSSKWVNISESTVMSTTTMVSGWPDAIRCTYSSQPAIFYAEHMPAADGKYYYRFPASSPATPYGVKFNADKTWNSEENITTADCQNKSIGQLYASGQAYNFIGNSSTAATAAGVSGSIQFRDGNGAFAGRSDLVVANGPGGFVGIGTGAPSTSLHVVGNNIRVQESDGVIPGFSIKNTSGGANEKVWQNYYHAGLKTLYFTALNDAESVESPWMQVLRGTGISITGVSFPNGNVGIGTISPLAKLHLSGADDATNGQLLVQSSGGKAQLSLVNASGFGVSYGAGSIGMTNSGGSQGMAFALSGTTHMTLSGYPTPGNLGIGKVLPLAKLDVAGTISASDAIQVGQSALACKSSISGSLRYSAISSTVEYCQGTAWVSMGPSATDVPSFSVDRNNSAQSFAQSTWVVVQWTRELNDNYNAFSSNRFTAPMPGMYLFTGGSACAVAGTGTQGVSIYKNGAAIAYSYVPPSGGTPANRVSVLTYMNGTTDYVELASFCATSATGIIGDTAHTNFQGTLIASGNGLISGTTGGAGVSAMASLTDVVLTNIAGRDYLRYDAGTSKWVNISESTVMSTTTMTPNFPDAITCSGSGGSSFWDLYGVESGYAYYAIRSKNFASYMTFAHPSGAYGAYTDGGSGWTNYMTTCANKSIAQLYAAGQAFNFIGSANVASTALGDRITSGTAPIGVIVNSATSSINLTSGATTWGYLSSGASYLPKLGVGSAPSLSLDVSGSGRFGGIETPSSGIGLEVGYYAAGDMAYVLGYDRGGTRYTGLTLNNFMYVASGTVPKLGVGTSTPVATLTVSGTISATNAIQVSGSSLTCNAGLKGAMRYSNISSTIEYCQGTAWVSMGPSATDVPAFSVSKSGSQTVAATVTTLLTWDVEEIDSRNNFASNRFTPTVAGNYFVSLGTRCTANGGNCQALIYKNGGTLKRGLNLQDTDGTAQVSLLVYMNGTTDYLEGYVYSGGTSILGTAESFFSGFLVSSGNGLAGGGGATPAGNSNDVQFNSSGALAADSGNFTYDGGVLKAPMVSATNISGSLIQVGSGNGASCDASRKGAMRYSNISSTIEYCQGSAWTSFGPSATEVPSFSVNRNGVDQTIAAGGFPVLVSWTTKSFDVGDNFNLSTGRYTPTVAGKYWFNLLVRCSGTTQRCIAEIRKNGVSISNVGVEGVDYTSPVAIAPVLVYMNGSTDYVDAWVVNANGTTLVGAGIGTRFEGVLIAPGNGVGGGGAAIPAGNTADVQFNSSGALAADTGNFTYASGLLKAPIISATTQVQAPSVSLTAAGVTWGYLQNNGSYLPSIASNYVSASTVSVSGVVQVSGSSLTCAANLKGAMRYSNTSSTIEYCQGTAWTSMGSSDTLPVSFLARKSGSVQTVASNATNKVTFESEDFDTGGGFSNSTFTAPVPGRYLFTATLRWTPNASGDTAYIALNKNGSSYAMQSIRAGSSNHNLPLTVIADAAVGDTFEVVATAPNTGSSISIANQGSYTYFAGAILGPQAGGSGSAIPAGSSKDIQFNTSGALDADTGLFVYDKTNHRLGVGTAVPTAKLEVAGDISGTVHYFGDANAYLSYNAANPMLNWDGNDYDVYNRASNYRAFFIGGAEKMRIDGSGNVSVTGSVQAYSFLHPSDRRLKDDITTIGNADEILGKLRGTHFRWKSNGEFSYGLIAQEVEEVVPEMVKGADSKVVDYDQLSAILIEGWKNHQKSIQALQAANDNLRQQLKAANDNQEKAIEGLERRMRKLEAGGAGR